MKNALNLMAFDLGSSNGRGILGRFDGERIALEEVYRFENGPIRMNGMVYWDMPYIYSNMLKAFSKYAQMGLGELACFGIDAWGNDYGLLDKNGQLLSNARSARHMTQADVDAAHAVVPGPGLYRRTGLASYSFYTLYQLYRRVREGDPGIENAHALLMIPDLLAFLCTGEMLSEYTITSTTMMYNPALKDWDRELIGRLSIPERILQPIGHPGTLAGCLTDSVALETGAGRVPYALVGSHDTASAAAAVPVGPGEDNYAFCSAGTWCLFGIETDAPIIDDALYARKFSSEGTVQGGFRLLKNMTGMWILQECMKRWNRGGRHIDYGDLAQSVEKCAPFKALIDVDAPDFFDVVNMPRAVQEYCARTGQAVPETPGEIARCFYESLALKYRYTLGWLDRAKGRPLERIYIVGGGGRSKVLNQMIADCTGRKVVTGPIEGACMGNLLTQAIALGEIKDLAQLRQVVRNSSPLEDYRPAAQDGGWDEAYARFLSLMEKTAP